MAQTHTLSADTRMEDIAGLASGDTIALAGYVLTCETDLSAITGLLATGSGTIRILNGGYADFSGKCEPKIEAGTSSIPLPPSGSYGFPGRSSAAIKLPATNNVVLNVESHCETNETRKQIATVASSTSTSVTFSDDMELQAGDVIGFFPLISQNNNPNWPYTRVLSYDNKTFTAQTESRSYSPPNGAKCVLLTVSFCLEGNCFPSKKSTFIGDEIGLFSSGFSNERARLVGSAEIGRLVIASSGYLYSNCAFGECSAKCRVYVSNIAAGGMGEGVGYVLQFERAFCPSLFLTYTNYVGIYAANAGNSGFGVRVGGGEVPAWPIEPFGRVELVDTVLYNTLYSSLRETAEVVVRTTNPPTCNIHRAGGIATLQQRADLSPAIALPDAWLLQPTTGSAWHDEPRVVPAGATLAVQWYSCLLDNAATAGVQILDGDNPLFGQVALNMGVAETLAEYTLPSGTAVNAWQPVKQLFWPNTSGQDRKVVLRGWASGGNAYSKITAIPGGIA